MEGIHGKHISIATLFIIVKASTTMESVQLSSFLISTILPRSTLPVRYFSKKNFLRMLSNVKPPSQFGLIEKNVTHIWEGLERWL